MKFETFNKTESDENIIEEDNNDFDEEKLSFKERRELKKIKDIFNEQIEVISEQDKIEINDSAKRGKDPSEKRINRQEAYKELKKDKEEVDIEKTLIRLNEEKNQEAKEKIWTLLSYANAKKAYRLHKKWYAEKTALKALAINQEEKNQDKIKTYIDTYTKEHPFTEVDTEKDRSIIKETLERKARIFMDLNINELKKKEKELDDNYKKEDEEMLRFREIITKKYYNDDEDKQSEMKIWNIERDEELIKSSI